LTSPMETFPAFGFGCSRLVLGTAQLGMPYGVANKTGRPELATARAMIHALADGGVTVIDTAAAYGASEEVVGSIVAGDPPLCQDTLVVTKLDPLAHAGDLSDSDLAAAAAQSIARSLGALRMDRLPLVLFHRAGHLTLRGGLLMTTMDGLMDAGKVGAIGVSVYAPDEAEAALSMDEVAAVQLPANVFDHRFLVGGQIEHARDRGVIVFGRSPYLQGVLIAPPESLPLGLAGLREPVAMFHACCAAWGRSPADVALAFVRSFAAIRGIVVGMETEEQARANLGLFSTPPLEESQVNELLDRFGTLPAHLVNPSLWPQ
jgi:aryl-alcohol dehydrogenase-like predicted oxidoreductase